MTCETPEMSSPRAAMSVATSSFSRPPLKAIITPSRAPWDMSPCSVLTRTPLSPSERDSRSAPIFVREKMIAWSGRSALSTLASASAFSRSDLTSTKYWSTVSIVSVAARTLTISGSYMNLSASLAIGGGIVAEKSAVWRPEGVRERIVSTSSRKPRSSISSASSSTTKRASRGRARGGPSGP